MSLLVFRLVAVEIITQLVQVEIQHNRLPLRAVLFNRRRFTIRGVQPCSPNPDQVRKGQNKSFSLVYSPYTRCNVKTFNVKRKKLDRTQDLMCETCLMLFLGSDAGDDTHPPHRLPAHCTASLIAEMRHSVSTHLVETD